MKKIYLLLALLLVLSSSAVMGSLNDSTDSYYRLDVATTFGTITTDGVNNPLRNGTLLSSPITGVTGHIGQAYNFSNRGYVNLTDVDYAGNLSFGLWLNKNKNSAAYDVPLSKSFDGSQRSWAIYSNPDGSQGITCGWSVANVQRWDTAYHANTPNLGQWYFAICVYNADTDTMETWIDGSLDNTHTVAGAAEGNAARWTISKDSYAASGYFNATIDEVMFFNKVLNSTEILELNSTTYSYPFYSSATNFTITASNNYAETLSVFNATISGTTYSTTNGTIVTPYLTNHTSLVNITINAASHDERNYTNQNISSALAAVLNFSYYRLNITAQSYTGTNITSFTIRVNSTNYSTTTGSVILNLTKNAVYNVSIDATNYSLDSALVNMTTWTVNHTFILYPDNSLFITIYDESTAALINTTNVTITFYSNVTSWSNLTDTGSFSIANLTAGEYSLRFEATGYAIRNYLITVGDRTTQTLSAYLVNSTDDTIFTVKDQDTNEVITDATMTMYRQIGGSWATVESKYTDITGKAQFYYDTGGSYKFYLSKSGYTDYVFYLNPILFSTYDVYMSREVLINYSQDFDRLSIIYSPQVFQDGELVNFTFIISSPLGELIAYGINLTYPGGSSQTAGYNAIGSQLTATVNITGATVYDVVELNYYYTTTISGRRNFTALLPISINDTNINGTFMANRDNTYGLGIFERMLIVTIILIFVVGISTMIGQPIPGLVLGLLVFGYMAFIGFTSLWTVIPSLVIGFIFLVWKSGGT